MRKMLTFTLFFLFYILASGSAMAADFGLNSANIKNAYFYTKTGSQLVVGYGSKAFQYEYVHILGTEIVDGVACLKGISLATRPSEFTQFWVAQDILGDIYILKYWRGDEGHPVILGKTNADLMSTHTPKIGDVFFWDKTVVEVGVQVPRLSTGLGPYKNCVKARGESGDITYYAPNIGVVKTVHPGGTSGWELKEIFPAGKDLVFKKQLSK